MVVFYLISVNKDAGSIPKEPNGRKALLKYMSEIDTDKITAVGQEFWETFRFCETCCVSKTLRTKHCSKTDKCVREFDHYCVWIGNTVGRDNHREFPAPQRVEILDFLTLKWSFPS